MIKIKQGDYIKSDFASFIQGTVIGFGTLGKRIPCYRIETPHGKIEYIVKGQADLLWTQTELTDDRRFCHYPRHD